MGQPRPPALLGRPFIAKRTALVRSQRWIEEIYFLAPFLAPLRLLSSLSAASVALEALATGRTVRFFSSISAEIPLISRVLRPAFLERRFLASCSREPFLLMRRYWTFHSGRRQGLVPCHELDFSVLFRSTARSESSAQDGVAVVSR